MTTGETSILSIGVLLNSFIILTTDLYLFELPLVNVDPALNPPYLININVQAKNLQVRFPASYPAILSLGTGILYSFTMATAGVQSISPDSEYIVFGYALNDTVCLLAVDVRQDRALEGPCNPLLGNITAYSLAPQWNFCYAGYIFNTQEVPTICSWALIVFRTGELDEEDNEEDDEVAMDDRSCTSLENCQRAYPLSWEYGRESKEKAKLDCGSVTGPASGGGPIVAAFRDRSMQFVYLFDDQLNVYTTTREDINEVVSRPLNQFISCKYAPPYHLSLTFNTAITAALLGSFLQLLICVSVYYSCRKSNYPSSVTAETGNRKSRSRQKKRRRSLKSQSLRSSDKSLSNRSKRSVKKAKSALRKSTVGNGRSKVSRNSSRSRSSFSSIKKQSKRSVTKDITSSKLLSSVEEQHQESNHQ